MATGTTLSELTSRQFLSQLDSYLAIYADAMDADPSLLPGRRELMRRHAACPEFRALAAREADGADGAARGHIVGFAYGFHGQGGQWWYDAVWNALARSVGVGY